MKYLDKFLCNILSWKMWVLAICTVALFHHLIDGFAYMGVVISILGGRIAEYKWGNGNGSKE